jgi:ornithine cyclodeaminase/alanine dehydrogenase
VSELLSHEECIDAVEHAFKLYGEGKAAPPAILGVHAANGGFHIKAGLMEFDRPYFVAKSNANFPNNRASGLPTIQGVVIVCDGSNGRLLALMDSIEITILRTGAATAVAAKYLSRADSKVVTIAGAGEQGRVSLKMLVCVRPLEKAFVYDIDSARAKALVDELSKELQIEIAAINGLRESTLKSDIVVTCTPSNNYFLTREHVAPGTFVAAVGSDSEHKQELEPALLKTATLVTDITEQCATIGELHHAIDGSLMIRTDVHAELGQIVAGVKPARTSDDQIIIFDSTGMGLQDVATAVRAYQRSQTSNKKKFVF